jgi:hypothetical protein
MANIIIKDIDKSSFVTTLVLGSQPRQKGCKGASQEEARKSHHVLPGM